jgi:hypothetical protein
MPLASSLMVAGERNQALLFCPQHAPPSSRSGFLPVSQLQQYVYLLRCALKRLCGQLRITCKEMDEKCNVLLEEKLMSFFLLKWTKVLHLITRIFPTRLGNPLKFLVDP